EFMIVDTNHHHVIDGVVGRHGQQHTFGASREVLFQLLPSGEFAGRFDHYVDGELLPRRLCRIPEAGHQDPLGVDVEGLVIERHLLAEGAHHGVILEQVRQALIPKDVVDADHLHVRVVTQDAKDTAADAAKAVDGNPDAHDHPPYIGVRRSMRSTTRWAKPPPPLFPATKTYHTCVVPSVGAV